MPHSHSEAVTRGQPACGVSVNGSTPTTQPGRPTLHVTKLLHRSDIAWLWYKMVNMDVLFWAVRFPRL